MSDNQLDFSSFSQINLNTPDDTGIQPQLNNNASGGSIGALVSNKTTEKQIKLNSASFDKQLKLDRTAALNNEIADVSAGRTAFLLNPKYANLNELEKEALWAKSTTLSNAAQIKALEDSIKASQGRTAGEALTDTGLSIAKGGIGIGAMGYGLADLASRAIQAPYEAATGKNLRSLDEVLNEEFNAGSQNFEKTRKIIDSAMSEPTKIAKEAVELKAAERLADKPNRLKADATWWDVFVDETGSAKEQIKALADNPLAAVDMALESALMMVVPGGIAGIARNAVTKGMTKEQAAEFAKTEAGKKALDKATASTSALTIGAMEGLGNAVEAKGKINEMSTAELADISPFYRDLLSKGYTPEEAKNIVAQNVFDSVGAISALSGILTSKLTGTDKVEGNLFGEAADGLISSVAKVTGSTAKEAVEEGLQGIGGEFAKNVAEQTYVDPNQELSEGLGVAAGSGIVAGGLTGAALTGASEVGRKTVNAVQDVAVKTAAKVESLRKVKEAITTGDYTKLVDKSAPDYSPRKAAQTLLSNDVISSKELQESPEKLKKHLDVVGEELNVWETVVAARLNRVENSINLSDEQKNAELNKIEALDAERLESLEIYSKLLNKLEEPNIDNVVSKVNQSVENNEPVADTDAKEFARYLGSAPESIKTEDMLSVISNPSVSTEVKSRIANKLAAEDAVSVLENTAGLSQAENVHKQILTGNKEFKGIYTYQKEVAAALANKNKGQAERSINQMESFVIRHSAKADLAAKTYAAFISNSADYPALAKEYSDKYTVNANKPAVINENSKKLVNLLAIEKEALNKALVDLKDGINFEFGKTYDLPDIDFTQYKPAPKKVKPAVTTNVTDLDKTKPVFAEGTSPASPSEAKVEAVGEVTEAKVDSKNQFIADVKTWTEGKKSNRGAVVERDLTAALPAEPMEIKLADRVVKAPEILKPKKSVSLYSSVKNFFGSVPALLGSKQLEATEAELEQLRHVFRLVQLIGKNVNAQYVPNTFDPSEDGLSVFVDASTKKLDPKVVEAVSIAGMNWLRSEYGDKSIPKDYEINIMLNRDDDYPVSGEEHRLFNAIGFYKTLAVESIGQEALELLGVSMASNMPMSYQEQVTVALGELALAGLTNAGFIEQTLVNRNLLINLPDSGLGNNPRGEYITSMTESDTSSVNDRSSIGFVKIPLSAQTENWLKPISRSRELFKKVFDLETQNTMPLRTKPEQLNKVTNKGNAVPKEQLEKALAASQNTWKVKDTFKLWEFLDEDSQKETAGIILNLDNTHISKRDGLELSKHPALEREIALINEWAAEIGEDNFYIPIEVWTQGRMGYASAINPQTSKVHRYLVGLSEQATTIDPKIGEEHQLFKLAIAQRFGIDIDKLTNDVVNQDVADLWANPVFTEAVEAAKDILAGNVQDRLQTTKKLMAGVRLGGQGTGTLDAIFAMTKYDPVEPFETDIMLEMDGITNGPIIGLLLFGGAANAAALLKRIMAGGLYASVDYGSFTEWKAVPGNEDIYVGLKTTWQRILDLKLQRLKPEVANSLNVLVGSISRSMAKGPITETVFGSGAAGVKQKSFDSVIEAMYDKIADRSKPEHRESVITVANALKTILGKDSGLTVENSNKFVLSAADLKKFNALYDQTYGESLSAAIQEEFNDFLEVRTMLNRGVKAAHDMFNAILDKQVLEKEKELGRELSQQEFNKILGDLKKEGVFPSVKHGLSNAKAYAEFIPVTKEEKVPTTKRNKLKVKGVRKNELDAKGKPTAKSGSLFKSTTTGIRKRVYKYSVGGPVLSIHNTDGLTMLDPLSKYPALNVHDSIGLGLKDAIQGNKDINESLRNQIANKDLIQDLLDVYGRALTAAKKYGVTPIELGSDKYNLSLFKAHKEIKQEALKQIRVWSQYQLNDAAYVVPRKVEPVQQAVVDFVRTLGSADNFPKNFNPTEIETVQADNVLTVFDKLVDIDSTITENHAEILRDLMGQMAAVMLPVNVAIDKGGVNTQGRYEALSKQIDIVIGESSPTSTLAMGPSETLAHEMTHHVFENYLSENVLVANQIEYLWKVAKANLTAKDLAGPNPTAEDLARAESVYNYVFNNPKLTVTSQVTNKAGLVQTKVRTQGLSEFLAFGLTNPLMMEALRKPKIMEVFLKGQPKERAKTKSNSKVTQAVDNAFNWVMEKLREAIQQLVYKYTGMNNLTGDRALFKLAMMLTGSETKARSKFMAMLLDNQQLNTKAAEIIRSWVLEPLNKVAKSSLVRKSKVKVVAAAGSVTRAAMNSNAADWAKAFKQVNKRLRWSSDNLAVALAHEVVGRTKRNEIFHILLRMTNKFIEQMRVEVSREYKVAINDMFDGDLTQDNKIALTKLIRADLSSLFDGSAESFEYVKQVLSDKKFRISEIERINKQLVDEFPNEGVYYTKMAYALGQKISLGINTQPNTLNNAYAIVMSNNVKFRKPKNANVAIDLIDRVATLRAIETLDAGTYVKNVSDLISAEEAKGKDYSVNGLTQLLNLYKDYQNESLGELFGQNRMQTIKGYVRDIYDPNIDVIFITEDQVPEMVRMGYTFVKEVTKDSRDPNQGKLFMYKSDNKPLSSYDTSIVTLEGMNARGADLFKVHTQTGALVPSIDAFADRLIVKNETAKQVNAARWDNSDLGSYPLSPILDEQGNITGYRYMMTEADRDALMGRDDAIDNVFGHTVANMKAKVNSNIINTRLINVLKEQYDKEFKANPSEYVLVGPKSSKPEYREMWKLIPQSMRETAVSVFGKDGIWLREADYRLIFGSRRLSWSSKQGREEKYYKSKIMGLFGQYIAKGLDSNFARTTENVWQEIVKMAKDIIVVKSGSVLVGNVMSNFVLLKMMGLSLKDIYTYHKEAFVGLEKYQKEKERLNQLTIKLKAGKSLSAKEKADLKLEIANLNDSLTRNKMSELIDAGVYQSITEDVMLDEDDKYTYKSKLEKLAEPVTSKIPDVVKDIGNVVFMTHNTKLYQFMRNATQMSDFVARYALHEHNKANGMAAEKSIEQIMDIFINYDLPTHPTIQYMNDMGLLMFTKYFVRVQKVLWYMLTKRTANVAILLGIEAFIGANILEPMDSNFTQVENKFNSPLGILDTWTAVPVTNFDPLAPII